MKQSLESFGTEIKGWIPTSAVTMLYFSFFNASINLEHQVPHWDTLLHPSISECSRLNLLVLTTCSEASEFNSNICAPYPTQFWGKVQFYHRFSDFFEDWCHTFLAQKYCFTHSFLSIMQIEFYLHFSKKFCVIWISFLLIFV